MDQHTSKYYFRPADRTPKYVGGVRYLTRAILDKQRNKSNSIYKWSDIDPNEAQRKAHNRDSWITFDYEGL